MKKQITHISVHQSSTVIALMYAVLSSIMIPIGAIIFLMGGKDKWSGLVFIFLPIFYAVFGYIFLALFFCIYNLIAKFVGGVEFTVADQIEDNQAPLQ
jgi:hypothetical protein